MGSKNKKKCKSVLRFVFRVASTENQGSYRYKMGSYRYKLGPFFSLYVFLRRCVIDHIVFVVLLLQLLLWLYDEHTDDGLSLLQHYLSPSNKILSLTDNFHFRTLTFGFSDSFQFFSTSNSSHTKHTHTHTLKERDETVPRKTTTSFTYRTGKSNVV